MHGMNNVVILSLIINQKYIAAAYNHVQWFKIKGIFLQCGSHLSKKDVRNIFKAQLMQSR